MSGNNVLSRNGEQQQSKGNNKSSLKFEGGQTNSHDLLDSKDERSIANKLEEAEQKNMQEKQESEQSVDPTLPARNHGNEPSKGAKIDASLQQEEEEYLERKGKT